MSPSVYRPLIWLGPLSVLAGAVFLQITNIGGVAGAIQSAAFAEIETLLPQLRMGLLQRPVFAQHVEILFLGLAGLCIVIVLARTTIMWAGMATLLVIATGIVFSWWMAADAGLFFDVSYATLTLAAVFAIGCVFYILVGVSARTHIRRSLAQHLSPVALAAIARRLELLKLAGESRNMTYLVCAIRGFPELTDAFADDAKGLSQLTRRVMTPLVQTILDRGGAIDRLTPGGLSAFFNAPLDDPEHAVHACEGALRMTEEMEKINLALERERRSDGSTIKPISIGIGINTGLGAVGDFGTSGRSEYTVAGRSVQLADEIARISGKYGPAIIVGEATRNAAERNFAFLEVDLLASGPEGKPQSLFALLGNPLVRASPKFRALQSFHYHIFQSYRAQNWGKARELIKQCRALSGASPRLYELYLARIAYLEAHPPGEGWNGAFRPAQT